MSDSVITVEHLSKRYVLGQGHSGDGLRHTLERAIRSPFQFFRTGLAARRAPSEFWALKDVSLEVERGTVLGIIGRNGAGKSTLLKILSRITEPTSGRIRLKGRFASLLEVGTGFHPDLTGRENIFLNGAILGMRRAEIQAKFDEIVAFAEIDRFLDTPVKRYSSGMYVRLAFAVAAHLEPDVLIVDEVLAVGDAQFQRKCLGKMQDVSRQEGRTVVFVSHNMQAVSTLTTRCLLLREGRVVVHGPTDAVIGAYLADGSSGESVFSASPAPDAPSVTRVEVGTSEPNSTHTHGRPLRLTFDLHTPRLIRSATFSFQIVDALRQPIVHMWLFDSQRPFCRSAGTYRLTCEIPRLRLYLGRYAVTTHLSEGYGGRYFHNLEAVCPFDVVMHGHEREWPWQEGACRYLEDGRWDVAESLVESPELCGAEIP
jgi:lipopolysaccharide transport system ATP-binding protein